MAKEYTPIRQIYAWVGFITLILIAIWAVASFFKLLDTKDKRALAINYCYEVDIQGDLVAHECE